MALFAAVGLGILIAGATAFYLLQSQPQFPSPSCGALSVGWNDLARQQSGFTYLCGLGSVSDGRLAMTLNNYHFADGSTIKWQCSGAALNGSSPCSSSGIYLLANATFTNIGQGDTAIGPILYARVDNNNTTPAQHAGNGEYGADAIFPGQYPDRSVPAVSGGVYLPPKASATYWFLFYLPNVSIKDIPNWKLYTLSLVNPEYGGTWDGGGGFSCVPVPCQDPMTELIVLAS